MPINLDALTALRDESVPDLIRADAAEECGEWEFAHFLRLIPADTTAVEIVMDGAKVFAGSPLGEPCIQVDSGVGTYHSWTVRGWARGTTNAVRVACPTWVRLAVESAVRQTLAARQA